MRKLLFSLLLVSLVFAPARFASAVLKPITLEVTGYLEKYDTSASPHQIVLRVGDETASGPLAEWCEFINERGTKIKEDIFFRTYMKRMITVEILEDTGEVVLCRVGS